MECSVVRSMSRSRQVISTSSMLRCKARKKMICRCINVHQCEKEENAQPASSLAMNNKLIPRQLPPRQHSINARNQKDPFQLLIFPAPVASPCHLLSRLAHHRPSTLPDSRASPPARAVRVGLVAHFAEVDHWSSGAHSGVCLSRRYAADEVVVESRRNDSRRSSARGERLCLGWLWNLLLHGKEYIG